MKRNERALETLGPDRGGVEQEALLRRHEARGRERGLGLREDPGGGAPHRRCLRWILLRLRPDFHLLVII